MTWKCVAETVFDNHQTASVACRCLDSGEFLVSSHECAVSASVAVFVFEEIYTFVGMALACHHVVLVHFVIDVCSGIFHIFRYVVDEILRGILY
jgi:hypothetical protein